MSKSKRGKSASLNEAGRWEAELVQTHFNEVSLSATVSHLRYWKKKVPIIFIIVQEILVSRSQLQ